MTLVSDSNFLLFTPMLAEVGVRRAGTRAHQRHPSGPPPRTPASATATVDGVDTRRRAVQLDSASERIPYDHLVLAVGSVPHSFGLPGVAEHAFTLKDLADATRLRDHVLGLLERADQRTDPRTRRRLLTFVVAGGGFAGTETVAELFDLVHGVPASIPGSARTSPGSCWCTPATGSCPSCRPNWAPYALARLAARGIEFRLGVRVSEAAAHGVRLSDGEWIATGTFVWTAGNRPSPLVARLAATRRNGALITDPALRVVGLDRVWAVGDCARIPDSTRAATPYPPTAQHAMRQGRAVADNIAATIAGRAPVDRSASARSGCWSRSGTAPPPARSAATASPGWPPGCCGGGSTWPSYRAPRNGCACCSTGCWTWCSPATSWSPPGPIDRVHASTSMDRRPRSRGGHR